MSESGVWLSDTFVDLHAPRIGPKGVYLWIKYLRNTTDKRSPTWLDLQEMTGMSEKAVGRVVEYLYAEARELNDFDMRRLHPDPKDSRWWSDDDAEQDDRPPG